MKAQIIKKIINHKNTPLQLKQAEQIDNYLSNHLNALTLENLKSILNELDKC